MYVHNHWLEQWLDLRYRLGWGQPSDVLRTNRNLLALIGLLALLFLGVGIASFTSKHGRLISPLAIAQTYPGTMLLFTGCTLALAIPVLSWHLTLRRAQVQGITLINGVCFALIQHLPHVVFARMGLSERDARWYALPAEWEKIVKMPDKHYELELRRGMDAP